MLGISRRIGSHGLRHARDPLAAIGVGAADGLPERTTTGPVVPALRGAAVDACYKLIRLTIDEALAEEFRAAAKEALSRGG